MINHLRGRRTEWRTAHKACLLPHNILLRGEALLVLSHEVLKDLILQLSIFHRQIFITAFKQTLTRDISAEAIIHGRVFILFFTVSHCSNSVSARPSKLLVSKRQSYELFTLVRLIRLIVDVTATLPGAGRWTATLTTARVHRVHLAFDQLLLLLSLATTHFQPSFSRSLPHPINLISCICFYVFFGGFLPSCFLLHSLGQFG